MASPFNIHKDISKAETLPASFYRDSSMFETMKDQIFLKSWQWVGDQSLVKLPKSFYPFVLLDGYLTEPMLLTHDNSGNINCLTNVCTHRGNILAMSSG